MLAPWFSVNNQQSKINNQKYFVAPKSFPQGASSVVDASMKWLVPAFLGCCSAGKQ
jgi:hypothetical protein